MASAEQTGLEEKIRNRVNPNKHLARFDQGTGPYTVRYGVAPPEWIPEINDYDYAAKRKLWEVHPLRKWEFHDNLRESVRKHGFKNPILGWQKDRGYITWPYGGSRASLARFENLPVPAFIVDWSNDPRLADWEEITTIEQALTKFQDPPTFMYFATDVFHFHGCRQLHVAEEGQAYWTKLAKGHVEALLTNDELVNKIQQCWVREDVRAYIEDRKVKVRVGARALAKLREKQQGNAVPARDD